MLNTLLPSPLFEPLVLVSGAVIPNRIAKAAMEENMADHAHLPGPALVRLYERWAKGGAGLILTGNVMIDATAMTGPAGVLLDSRQPIGPFRAWARAVSVPRALEPKEITALIERFATTAKLAEEAGFTGVQIHAAHGYLLSQFLSPLSNRRTDEWGGSLENRARMLLETIKAVRSRVAPEFCVSVKLNSADFQRGGFEVSDADCRHGAE